jgi:hypothetical protein
MDDYALLASFAFGIVGMGMFTYGRKASRFLPLGAGVALMVVPYFLSNLIAMLIVCGGISVLPLVVRES